MPTAENTYKISKAGTTAEFNLQNAELFSLMRNGRDVIWGGGAPEARRPQVGWKNSEIVMFPIVGQALNGSVLLGETNFPMAKHGLARDLPWVISTNSDTVSMVQVYVAGQKVESAKKDISIFPRSYRLVKKYSIDNYGRLIFTIEIENRSAEVMPYAVGWHPAFRTPAGATVVTVSYGDLREPSSQDITLERVRSAEGRVVVFEESTQFFYRNSGFDIIFKHDFGRAQIWDKGEGYVALEPITANSLSRASAGESLDLLLRPSYRRLKPGEKERFRAEIEIVTR